MHVLIGGAQRIFVVHCKRAYPGGHGERVGVWLRIVGVINHGENAADFAVEIRNLSIAERNSRQLDPSTIQQRIMEPNLITTIRARVISQRPIARWSSIDNRRLKAHFGSLSNVRGALLSWVKRITNADSKHVF